MAIVKGAHYPVERYRKRRQDGLGWDAWVPALHPQNKEKALRLGYDTQDFVVVKDGVVVSDGLSTADEALAAARALNDAQKAKNGSKMPKQDSFYWELRVIKRHPDAVLSLSAMFPEIAATVATHLPGYGKEDTQTLYAELDAAGFWTCDADCGGEVPKDGSLKTLATLLVLSEIQRRIEEYWGQWLRLTLVDGDDALTGHGSHGRLRVLEAAGLDRSAKKAPATLAAIALGLLPAPIDLSAAPGDDFYL